MQDADSLVVGVGKRERRFECLRERQQLVDGKRDDDGFAGALEVGVGEHDGVTLA